MKALKVFKLEEYLAKYEFSAPYLLCCSDAESFSMQEILDMASAEYKKLWNELRLGYTETFGLPALREMISKRIYPTLQKENILCFSGAEEGIYATLNVICKPGDHVIVLTPCYQSLLEIPQSIGVDITTIALREEREWKIDLEEIKSAIKERTKCVVMNFPHNPTGQVIEQEELDELVKILNKHRIWLFSDEVYRLLGTPHKPWAKPAAEVYDRAISLGVMSKAFGMAGLRIGWIACQNKELLYKIRQFKDYLSICNSGPSEMLSLMALHNMKYILERNNKIVNSNLAILDQFFAEFKDKFSWVKPQGGCVGFVKYHSSESVENFCDKLVKDRRVLLMPASIYDMSTNHFRIGFGRSNMQEALNILIQYIRK
jgi:aspartate/methionine/tyrosine aminotransferase